jgi:hypothetical protein
MASVELVAVAAVNGNSWEGTSSVVATLALQKSSA